MKKISICTRYTPLGASSRLRFYNYHPLLEEQGVSGKIFPLLGDRYLNGLYRGKRVRHLAAASLVKRLMQLPLLEKELLIEYELLPFLPVWFEELILRRRKYILSFDDAVWEKYRGTRLEGKFERLVSRACGVISANNSITDHLKPYNERIIKIPTAIDLEKYTSVPENRDEEFTIAWIGTPVTYQECLLPFSSMLQEASARFDFKLLVIASDELQRIDGVNMEFVNWSSSAEAELLKRAHIGIMPLPENDFMRGKSAYKLIQYLASGLPCIASPVGENSVLLSQGEVGFAAGTVDEWISAIGKLKEDVLLRSRLGANALELAGEYSIRKHAVRMADFIKECFNW